MIQQIRARQAYQQAQNIQQIRANLPLATYQSRDAQFGDRILLAPDGGQIRATYLSTNQPTQLYNVPPGAIGIPGFAINK